MQRCKTCKYWTEEQDEWLARGIKGLDVRECRKIQTFWDATEWESPDYERRVFTKEAKGCLAFAQDGSDYQAWVYTLPEFGCVQWETKSPNAEKGAN